jgi:uncharacterized protein DUF5677
MDDFLKNIEAFKKFNRLFLSKIDGVTPDDIDNIEKELTTAERKYKSIITQSQEEFMNIKIEEIIPLALDSLKNLHSFIEKEIDPFVNQIINKGFESTRQKVFISLYNRIFLQIKSLLKLNKPEDIQAIASLNRCLLEINVDLIILHYGDTSLAEKYDAYSFVDRYIKMEKIVNHFERADKKIDITNHKEFISNPENKERYKEFLNIFWNGNKPYLWHGNSIFNLFSKANELDKSSDILHYYRTLYSRYSWYVHSGLTGLEGLNEELLDSSAASDWMLGSYIALNSIGIICEEFKLDISTNDLQAIVFSQFLDFFLKKGSH